MSHTQGTLIIATAAITSLLLAFALVPGTDATAPSAASAGPRGSETSPRREGPIERQALADVAQPPRGFYTARPGRRFVFEARCATRTHTRQEHRGGSELHYSVQADAEWVVLDRRRDELLVQVRCLGARIEMTADGRCQDPGKTTAIAAELGMPTVVRMRSDGRFVGLRFAREMGPEARCFARALACALQQQVVEDPAGPWELTETDSTGVARFRYGWRRRPTESQPGILHKQKLRYEKLHAPMALEAEGEATARMCAARGFVVGVEGRETFVVHAEQMKATIHSEVLHRCALVAHDFVAVPDACDWDAPFESVDGKDDAAAIAAESELARRREQLKRVDARDLVHTILARLEAGTLDSNTLAGVCRLLTQKIVLEPDTLRQLAPVLTAPDLSDEARYALLGAVGAADHRVAEGFLHGVLSGRHDARLRDAAALALFQIRAPQPETVTTVLDIARRSHVEQRLASTSLLLLGAFARGPARAATIDSLLSLETTVAQRGQITSWLEALDNARSPRASTKARRYLAHARATVRAAAARASSWSQTEDATRALVARLAYENVPAVRAALVRALAGRSHPEARRALQHVAATDPSEGLRRLAARTGN